MERDSATALRNWAQSIEEAWGIAIGFTDEGAFMLETTAGALVGIEPVPEQQALVLTAVLGELDADTPLRLYQALLALNLQPALSGSGCVGVDHQSQTILLRLIWSPAEPQWSKDGLLQLLAAFGSHVDQLTQAIASREIESILVRADEAAALPRSLQVANLAEAGQP